MIPKGYRAREKAAFERSRKRIASPEVRAQRAALLHGEPVKTEQVEANEAAKAKQADADTAKDEAKDDESQSEDAADEADEHQDEAAPATKPRRARKTQS